MAQVKSSFKMKFDMEGFKSKLNTVKKICAHVGVCITAAVIGNVTCSFVMNTVTGIISAGLLTKLFEVTIRMAVYATNAIAAEYLYSVLSTFVDNGVTA